MMKKGLILSLIVMLAFAGWSICAFSNAEKVSSGEDIERVSESIRYSILECYAIEGKYPESIDYLKDHYGIYFNSDLYQIHYRYLGSNMLPEFSIFEKGGQ